MPSRTEPNVKRIGLIGGLSPESTAHYYQILCREYNRQFGQLNFPEITIESLNLQTLVRLFEVNDWNSVAAILLDALERLHRAGADFAAILANTPHNAYELIRDVSPLSIVTIMEATATALVSDNRKRVGLLGTRSTMEYGFFQKHFQSLGIETIVPNEAHRRELDRIIWEELSHGKIRPDSRIVAQTMLSNLADNGAEAMILGCTELCLLIKPEDSRRPLYDTTELHATAILGFALTDHEIERSI
jgi:aspartate racemase